MQLELLSPAKNYEQGVAAINHGADALYIGAPAFGARSAATNSIEDIERLVKYAHLFRSKIFVTVNTLLFDNEIESAVKMIHQLYNAGCDALIIQDLGLLECDLPPIALHASTQTHNATLERVKFMEQVGFQRVILARETSLEQMQAIRKETSVELEAFVQGALCVSYSGQCYMSQYLNDRSGNRGCCGQPCRSSYNLYNEQGKLLRRDEHLLSLKDFNASQQLASMIDAGITSFKIEGRLKDISYVKNVTAYYRQLLDNIMLQRTDSQPASSGHCTYYFTPDLEKTFNRGFTDYFLQKRQPMASLATQKSLGKKVGKVKQLDKKSITVDTKDLLFTAGDGLCFYNSDGQLEGFLVNHVQGNTIVPNRMPDIKVGETLWRNNDFAFEKQLQGKSAVRKIDVTFILAETSDGLQLQATDSDNISAIAEICCEKTPARNPEKAQIQPQLSKLGDTPFQAISVENQCSKPYFIPTSLLNELRRNAIEQLIQKRQEAFVPKPFIFTANDVPYFEKQLDYRANILNHKAEQFYRRHGVCQLEYGLEKTHNYNDKALMTTKYCLRYELKQCLMKKNNHTIAPDYQGNLYLQNNHNRFLLQFDCKNCLMKILKEQN